MRNQTAHVRGQYSFVLRFIPISAQIARDFTTLLARLNNQFAEKFSVREASLQKGPLDIFGYAILRGDPRTFLRIELLRRGTQRCKWIERDWV